MASLKEQHCRPPEALRRLEGADVRHYLEQLAPGWQTAADGTCLVRLFEFGDFHATMAFVNAVAWIAHRQDHHPDLEVGYRRCRVVYSTHAKGGLTLNDFVCAARVDALFD